MSIMYLIYKISLKYFMVTQFELISYVKYIKV